MMQPTAESPRASGTLDTRTLETILHKSHIEFSSIEGGGFRSFFRRSYVSKRRSLLLYLVKDRVAFFVETAVGFHRQSFVL